MKYTASILLLSLTLLTACHTGGGNSSEISSTQNKASLDDESYKEQEDREARERLYELQNKSIQNSIIDNKINQIMTNRNLSFDQSNKAIMKLEQMRQ